MLIGFCDILDKSKNKVIVKINNEQLTIKPGDTLDILYDPFPDDEHPGAGIFEKMSFEEFCDNIEEDDGEFEFTDDLIYIYGIAKY